MAKLEQAASKNQEDQVNRLDMFGLVAKLDKLNTEPNGNVNFDMTVEIDSGGLSAGDKVNVYITSEGGKDAKSLETLKRGMGRGAGSLLMLENCHVEEDGRIKAQWLKQVAISASKVGEGDDRMMLRKMVTGFMEQAVISFRNPSQKEGEPVQIRFGFAAEVDDQWVVKGGKGGNVPFTRDWAVDKLKDVLKFNKEGTKGILVRTSMFEADKAIAATSLEELRTLATNQLAGSQNNEVVLRISDGERVMVRQIKNKYLGKDEGNQPAERTIDDAFSRSLFGYKEVGTDNYISIRNADLDALLKDPDIKMEMIPGSQIPHYGDKSQSTKTVLVNKFAEDPVNEINEYAVPFGVGAPQSTLIGMVVTTEPFKSGEVYMAGTPMALARDRFTLEGLPTANIAGKALERTAKSEVFDGDQFELATEAEIKAEVKAEILTKSAAPTDEENTAAAAQEVKPTEEAPPVKVRKF